MDITLQTFKQTVFECFLLKMMRCSLVPCSEATSGKRYCFLPKKTNDGHRALKKIAVRLNFHNQNEGTRRRGPVWTCWAIDSLNDVSLFPENLDPIVRQVQSLHFFLFHLCR